MIHTNKLNSKITLQPIFSYKILFDALYKKNEQSKLIMTNSARSSLHISLSSLLNIDNKIENIFLPDLICNEIIPLITNLDINIIFYSVDENLNPDVNFIEDNIKNKLSVILIVNYFGKLSDWNSLLDLKRKSNCIIIEDNAHTLFGKYNDINLGELGDISFNSLRKVIPVLSGSVLKYNKLNSQINLKKRLPNYTEFKYSLRGLKLKSIKQQNNLEINKKITTYDETLSIDYFSEKIFANLCKNESGICSRRKENYRFWENYLKSTELEILDISSSSCPYAMPCIYHDNKIAQKWISWGLINNINIIRWPLLPRLKSHKLKNKKLANILLFPVNHMHKLSSMELIDA